MILLELEVVPITIKSTRSNWSGPAAPGTGSVPRAQGSWQPGGFHWLVLLPRLLAAVCIAYQSNTRADTGTCDLHREMSCPEQRAHCLEPSDTPCYSAALEHIYYSSSKGICFRATWGVIKMKTD